MNRKRITALIILAAMNLSACGNEASTEVPAPSRDESLIIPITGATEVEAEEALTPTDLPEPAPTPGPRPTNAPNCTNSASFVTDVNIHDNTELVGGTAFTKTWRILNSGTCIWASDYSLTHYAEEWLSAPPSFPLRSRIPVKPWIFPFRLLCPTQSGRTRATSSLKIRPG